VGKLPVYERESVRHVWLLDPLQRTLETFRMNDGRYTLMGVHKDDDVINAKPFEVFALQMAVLWADEVQPGVRRTGWHVACPPPLTPPPASPAAAG